VPPGRPRADPISRKQRHELTPLQALQPADLFECQLQRGFGLQRSGFEIGQLAPRRLQQPVHERDRHFGDAGLVLIEELGVIGPPRPK